MSKSVQNKGLDASAAAPDEGGETDFALPEGGTVSPTPFGAAIRRRRAERRLKLHQVATGAGCAKSYLSMIENGVKVNPPSDELVARLEMALGLPAGELVRLAHWQTTPPTIRRQVEALESQRRAAVAQLRELVGGSGKPDAPLDELWRTGKLQRLIERLGGDEAGVDGHKGGARPPRTPAGNAWSQPLNAAMPLEVPLINSVAAGYPTDFSDLGYPARVADSYVRSPDVHDPDAFACRVVGDSMMPEYREGDIVVFSPARAVVSGADCFVRLEPDHDTTFKRVFFEGEDGREVAAASVRAAAGVPAPDTPVTHLRLQPLNGKYPARVVAREGVSGLYVAVSVTRKL